MGERQMAFGPFRLNLDSACVWRGKQALKLTPKALAVLGYLVERAGRLVTKAELFRAVWPEMVVGEGALSVCVRELRQALQDDARAPRYIATVHRRGYRFIGEVTSSQHSVVSSHLSQPILNPQPPAPTLVGREAELTQLHGWLDKALRGERQLIFVTGEAGIGKTTLVDAFLQTLVPSPQHPTPSSWLGRGQCIEQYGAGEAYMPILEALGRLCRETGGERLITLLNQHATTWLVQMPTLLDAAELETLQRKVQGATRERMLREMVEAVDAITAERPLVLRLEDLHWSDPSTLELLALLARRREPARLLVLGTYRPVDAIVREHPLREVKQELQVHKQCEELALRLLTEEAVEEYLAVRFDMNGGAHGCAPLQPLAHAIYQRTEGNPLFMVNVVDELISQGVFVQVGGQWTVQKEEDAAGAVPKSLRQMIEQQVERLSVEERRMLEAASVAGVDFSAAAVSAGVGAEPDVVEEQCTGLVRREQFLQLAGSNKWPDGMVAARYGFLHALYQEVFYGRLSTGRRQRLHQQIGEREEQAYGERAREIAAELAMHFERGWDYPRAVQYLQQAGENALHRSAHQEAISLLTKGLELLKTLPDTLDRAHQELTLHLALGPPLMATKGYAAPEIEDTYTRAHDLCQQLGETGQLFPVLRGMWVFYLLRADIQTAHEIGQQLLTLAQRVQDPALLVEAHYALGSALFFLGEVTPARTHFEQGIAFYDPQQHRVYTGLYGQDPGVFCRLVLAMALWVQGYADQALASVHKALPLARELAHSNSLAGALFFAAWLHQLRREKLAVHEQARAAVVLSDNQGFPFWKAWGTIMTGCVLAEQGQREEGRTQIHYGLTGLQATGAELARPYILAMLAEEVGKLRQAGEGLSLLTEALAAVERTDERWCEAELYRLKGELTLQETNQKAKGKRQKQLSVVSSQLSVPNAQNPTSKAHSEAEACFRKAINISRKQQAKSLELRATVSLARLWQQQGKQHEAHQMLSTIYNWFTEGFDTADLQEAKALLDELSH